MASHSKEHQGKKTHEQFLRNLEHKSDVPREEVLDREARDHSLDYHEQHHPEARQSDRPVSRQGMNQESRDHNKHNNPGQTGHGPQKHGPAEEKS